MLQGCGTGASSIFLATCGYRVAGIDIVQQAVDRATAAAVTAGVSSVVHPPVNPRPVGGGHLHDSGTGEAVFLRQVLCAPALLQDG
jgi:hypothetical protein